MGWRDHYLTKDTLSITEEPARAPSKSKSNLSGKKFVYCDEYKQQMAVLMTALHAERPEIGKKMSLSRKGKKHSPETVAKIVATRRANGGYVCNEETRAKLREHNLGKKRGSTSAETAAKISKRLKGLKRSEETCKQMSESAKLRITRLTEQGKPPPASKAIMTPNGVFSSATEVSRVAGVSIGCVYHWMKKYPEHYYLIKKDMV